MAKRKPAQICSNVDDFISSVNRDFSGAIIEKEDNTQVECVTTNLTSLDWALGNGLPKGRIIEVFGQESSGKTSLCLHIIGVIQRLGGKALFIDAEYAFDDNFAASHKIDRNNLSLVQPACGEEALNIVERGIGLFDIIVVDSVAALTPKAEIDGQMGDSHMGLQARMLSQALRKLTAKVGKSDTILIFINQLRMKIGLVFGNPEVTTGGNALKFYASIRMRVSKKEWLGSKDNPIGIHQLIKCVKNKVAPPFRSIELDLFYKNGYSVAKDIFENSLGFGIIQQKGKTYYAECCGETALGTSKKDALETIRSNKSIRTTLKKELKNTFNQQEFTEDE